MKIPAVLLLCLATVGCLAEVEAPSEEEAVLEESSEALMKGSYHGGSGLVFGNDPDPYRDCLVSCSQAKSACQNRNSQNIDDEYELMEPCDLYYAMCKGRCDSTFPQ